jgi:hypothetical protein
VTGIKKIAQTAILIPIIATSWLPLVQLSRMDASIYLPNGIRFLIAAIALLGIKLALAKEFPHLSLRIIHASCATALLAYFIPGYLIFTMIRSFPSGTFPLLTAFIPLWCILFWPVINWARGTYYLLFVALEVIGFTLFITGLRGGDPFSNQEIITLVLLVFSMGTYAAAIAMVRRVSWIHSCEDVNIWAMLIAGVLFCILGVTSGESPFKLSFNYYVLLITSAVITLSMGIYLYRSMAIESNTYVLFSLWIGGILGGELISMFWIKDTPLGLRTGIGTLLTLAPFFSGLGKERIHVWASHYISNTRRQGDRVFCRLNGYMKTVQGVTVKILTHDLSIGGLGVVSEAHIPIAENVVLSLPIQTSEWSQVSLDCQVVHMQKTEDPTWPYRGGLSFKKLHPTQRTLLIEFLARLSLESP